MARTPNDQSSLIDDPYDRTAYKVLVREMERGPSLAERAGERVSTSVTKVAMRVSRWLPSTLSEAGEATIRKMLSGFRALTIDPAFRSVRTRRVCRSYAKAGHAVDNLAAIRTLPLEVIDRVQPALAWRYSLGGAIEGAGAGVAITGGEVLAAGGTVAGAGAGAAPGAGTVVSAIAFDAATVLAASARVVAHVGAYYGYDTRLHDEQVFALAVVDWSSAPTEGAKTLAFQQLSTITQQLARGATWAQLSEATMVKVIDEIYLRLGFRLTKSKLGQAVPVAGIALGAGLNAIVINRMAQDATLAYRARHLSDKYGVTFGG